jgi:hypothetical protein
MAFSGAQNTRAGLYGGARPLYGSFAGKTAAPVVVDPYTRLGLYGGARPLYGSFAGKAEAVGGGAGYKSLRPGLTVGL